VEALAEYLVSVVIPVYNGAPFIRPALQTVFAQDYCSMEIIVVDDGSEDQTSGIIAAFPGVHYIPQTHQGVAAARNTGIAAAKGELVAFLDADDLWTPSKLTIQVDYLKKYFECSCVVARMRYFLQAGTSRPSWLREGLLHTNQVGYIPSALVARREVFEQIGGFDPSYQLSEDADWFFRAQDAGVRIDIIPSLLLYKRVHNSNLSYRLDCMQRELLRATRASIRRRRRDDPLSRGTKD
jgi:glycosyltransferase involved in cell wall biosynthesis